MAKLYFHISTKISLFTSDGELLFYSWYYAFVFANKVAWQHT